MIMNDPSHPVSPGQRADALLDELRRDDVLVRLPVLAVELLGPVPERGHPGVLREPGEGRLAAPAVLQDHPPVPLGEGREGHGEGLAAVQGRLCPEYPGPELRVSTID